MSPDLIKQLNAARQACADFLDDAEHYVLNLESEAHKWRDVTRQEVYVTAEAAIRRLDIFADSYSEYVDGLNEKERTFNE